MSDKEARKRGLQETVEYYQERLREALAAFERVQQHIKEVRSGTARYVPPGVTLDTLFKAAQDDSRLIDYYFDLLTKAREELKKE